MSKHNNYHNYNNYSSNNVKNNIKAEVEEVKAVLPENYEVPEEVKPVLPENYETPEPVETVETAEPVIEEPKPVIGIVVGCTKLNVREAANADADPVGTVEAGSEVEIDESKSTEYFYKVCTAAGLEGFCMKKFITIQ